MIDYSCITSGRFSHIGAEAVNYFNALIEIGNFTAIADHVTFCGAMNYPCIENFQEVNNFPFGSELGGDYHGGNTRGKIIIGSDVWIGHKVIILDGITIGDGARIGLGTIVAKDVPPYAVVVGNPGQIKKFRFTEEQIAKLLKIKWWNWPDETIKERVSDFKDIDNFLKKYG